MGRSLGTLWKVTTQFERIVIGCGLVSLLGNAFTQGGLAEALTVGGPAAVVLAALGYLGGRRLRRPHADPTGEPTRL